MAYNDVMDLSLEQERRDARVKVIGRRALIVGATSSLAYALCHELAEIGVDLVLAARDGDELNKIASDLSICYGVGVDTITMDFNATSFKPEQLIKKAKQFDLLFMLAGYMGEENQDDIENITKVINDNYTVPAQILTLAGEKLVKEGGGTIVVVSSVAGDRGRQSNYPYGSAKAGLTAFASGLRNRFFDKNVHVMTVKPGFVDTPLTYGMKSPLIASRESVAKRIVQAVEGKRNILYVPFFWWGIMFIISHIPEMVFKRLKL